MDIKIIKTLVKRELLDVFRDRKTVFMMLFLPVILYPLIFIGAMQIVSVISSSMGEQNYRVVIDAEDDDAFAKQLKQRQETETYSLVIVDPQSIDDYETSLNNEDIDVYISGNMQGGKMQYDVYYLSSVTNSSYMADLVMDAFDDYREEMTRQRVEAAGMNVHEVLEPVRYAEHDIASNEQSLGSLMGSILPFMLLTSLMTGTSYPAVDTTAGERERGTLETILTLPVTNRQLILSKFITVAFTGIITALLNILSMGGIAFYMYQVMDMQTGVESFDMAKFVPAIFVCVLCIFAFSLFISAVLMCVASFAKSSREANNFIAPMTMAVMFTGYISFIPNIELTPAMAMVPAANICLLIKNMLMFKVDYGSIILVLLSNVAYAAAAILFLNRIYDSEAILFPDGRGGLQVFEKRTNLKKGGVPTTSDVVFVIVVTLLLIIYAGSILQIKFGLAGLFLTQMILLLVPLGTVIYTKRDICLTYGLHRARITDFVGGAFLAVGMLLVNLLISMAMIALFPESAQNIGESFWTVLGDNMWSALAVIALAPAICEEMLFRGMILHSLKAKYRLSSAVIITAVLFGFYHMSLVKFLPTGILGVVLCLVVLHTGSIYPAMVMHFLNNALSVVISYYPVQVGKMFPILVKEPLGGFDMFLLAGAGLVLCLIGGAVLSFSGRQREDRSLGES